MSVKWRIDHWCLIWLHLKFNLNSLFVKVDTVDIFAPRWQIRLYTQSLVETLLARKPMAIQIIGPVDLIANANTECISRSMKNRKYYSYFSFAILQWITLWWQFGRRRAMLRAIRTALTAASDQLPCTLRKPVGMHGMIYSAARMCEKGLTNVPARDTTTTTTTTTAAVTRRRRRRNEQHLQEINAWPLAVSVCSSSSSAWAGLALHLTVTDRPHRRPRSLVTNRPAVASLAGHITTARSLFWKHIQYTVRRMSRAKKR